MGILLSLAILEQVHAHWEHRTSRRTRRTVTSSFTKFYIVVIVVHKAFLCTLIQTIDDFRCFQTIGAKVKIERAWVCPRVKRPEPCTRGRKVDTASKGRIYRPYGRQDELLSSVIKRRTSACSICSKISTTSRMIRSNSSVCIFFNCCDLSSPLELRLHAPIFLQLEPLFEDRRRSCDDSEG